MKVYMQIMESSLNKLSTFINKISLELSHALCFYFVYDCFQTTMSNLMYIIGRDLQSFFLETLQISVQEHATFLRLVNRSKTNKYSKITYSGLKYIDAQCLLKF